MPAEQSGGLELLTAFLGELATGKADLTKRLEVPSGDPAAPAGALLNSFLDALQRTLLSVEETVHEAGVNEARVRTDLGVLRGATIRQAESMKALAATVQNVASSATEVAAAAEQGAAHSVDMKTLAAEGQGEVQGAGRQLDLLAGHAAGTRQQVQALLAEVAGIGRIAGTVGDVASRTNLLSLNAAIEAAHAGVHGRGFAVVAAEIRRLAEQAARSAKEISAMVGKVEEGIRATGSAVSGLAGSAGEAAGAAARAGERMGEMYGLVADLAAGITQTSEAAANQAAMAEEMSASAAEVEGEILRVQNLAAGMSQRQISTVVERAQASLAAYRYGGRFEWALDLSFAAAAEVEAVMEGAVRDGRLRLEDLLDTDYTEIKGAAVGRLGRLFDVSRVPQTGFEPPKYATRSDPIVDQALIEACQRFWVRGQGRLVSVGLVDINGFAIALSANLCQAWTGDPARDVPNNRVKRLFDDPVGLRSARAGLPGGERVPQRAARSRFAREGIDLERPVAPGTFLAQTYARDTGAVVTDVAVPVHVQGRRYGSVRVGLQVT